MKPMPGNLDAAHSRDHRQPLDLKALTGSFGWVLAGAALGLIAALAVGLGLVTLDSRGSRTKSESIADNPLTSGSLSSPVSAPSKN
jgi:hypothetical protein